MWVRTLLAFSRHPVVSVFDTSNRHSATEEEGQYVRRSDIYIPGAGQVTRKVLGTHHGRIWGDGEVRQWKCGNESTETEVWKWEKSIIPPPPTPSAVKLFKMGKGGLFILWCMHKQEHVLSAVVWSLLYTAAFSATRNQWKLIIVTSNNKQKHFKLLQQKKGKEQQ